MTSSLLARALLAVCAYTGGSVPAAGEERNWIVGVLISLALLASALWGSQDDA